MAGPRVAVPLWGSLILAALLWAVAIAKPSIPMDFCASINTASMSANHSIYQSDGLCYGFCLRQYALAVVQEDSCWCSNYVPDKSTQVSTDKCNFPCPGFPDDVCGGNEVFGYMLLQKSPSGTLAAGTPVSATNSPPTVGKTVGPDPTVSTVTADGTVKTVTIVPTIVISSSPNSAAISSGSGSGLSTGAAVGIAVGVIISAATVVAGVACFFIKRKRKQREEAEGGLGASSQRGSASGMMGTPKTGEISENRYVLGADGRNMAEAWESSTRGKRRSALMPVDPRLDPFAKGIYNRTENKSHDSVASLRDDHDYSRRIQEPPRVLRAINPDPDDD